MEPPFIRSLPPPFFSFSLQRRGFTALILASQAGRTEAVKALLTVPNIDVNHADVSLYLLTTSM